MITKPKKGALLSGKFSRKSPSIDTEIQTFIAELRKLNRAQFVVAEHAEGDELEIDIFAVKTGDDVPTKKMTTMSLEQAAAALGQAAVPKEKKKASALAPSTSKGAGFKKK